MCRIDRRLDRRHPPAGLVDAELFRISDVVIRSSRRSVAAAIAVAIVAAIIVANRGATQPYESLAPQAANLRAQFNADAGKVRIVLLPAPS